MRQVGLQLQAKDCHPVRTRSELGRTTVTSTAPVNSVRAQCWVVALVLGDQYGISARNSHNPWPIRIASARTLPENVIRRLGVDVRTEDWLSRERRGLEAEQSMQTCGTVLTPITKGFHATVA